MSRERLFDILSRPAAAALALLVLVGASALLKKYDPKKEIERRFDARYCCPPRADRPNPFFRTDGEVGFTPARLYRMLDEYEGADVEDNRRFILYDFFYPFAYAIPLSVFILWLQREFSPEPVRRRRWWLFLLPPAAAAFDFVENAGMLAVLGAGAKTSNPHDGLVYVTILGNVLKSALLLLSAVLICSGLAGFVLKWAFGARFAREDSRPG